MANLEKFVERLVDIQHAQKEKTLTESDLKGIALEMGMTDGEWIEVQNIYNGHLSRAKGFIKYKNWDDAITECEQAIVLNPHEPDILYATAYSYFMRWEEKQGSKDKELALLHARKCLQVDPKYDGAFQLISRLRKPSRQQSYQQNVNQPPPYHSHKQHFKPDTYKQALPYSALVLALGIISIIFAPQYIGILPAIAALYLSQKAQQIYNSKPTSYTHKSLKHLRAGRITAVIGIVIFLMSFISLFTG